MNKQVLAVCYTPDGGILRYDLNESGKLSFVDQLKLDRPMYLIREGEHFYVLLNECFPDHTGGLQQLERLRNGALTAVGEPLSTKGRVPCHLCAWKENIYCANYVSGSVSCPPDLLAVHHGSGVHPMRQTSPHVHFVCVTPDNRYLAAVDLGLDQIITYDQTLGLYAKSQLPAGLGARHLIFSEDGKYAYCVGEMGGTVTTLRYRDGSFTPLETVSVLPERFHGKNLSAAIRRRGDNLYVSNRGHDSIAWLTLCEESVTPRQWFDCGGASPRDFEVTKQWLICANEDGNCITVLNRSDGSIAECVSAPRPLGIVVL